MLFEISSSSKVKIAKYLVTALQIYEQQQQKKIIEKYSQSHELKVKLIW